MQLKELSERTGVSPASIKFYLREGLLPAGRSVHATRAEYAELHVSRLELIQALRRVVGLNIAQIGSLLRMADDGVPRLELLAAVQRTVLGLDAVGTEHGDMQSWAGDAVVRFRNWPDVPSDARNSLNAHLALMESLGVQVPDTLLDAYSQAVDAIATVDISATTAPDDVNELIMTAAVGMHLHGQLVLKLLALAQASHAIRRYTKDA
ncbi:MerR family transcriptional regulator [Arthrobacter sp. FW305-BF8]|uniref:MerR family transcriptional regulator n=1 Tax=Arthrobacter sp. FW305-BF8 TaxID=2879617 RepID=UPI001F01C0FE|nr:MerR family transcriptional regulator [Arthrobacter sp. FW305-BF8]UKA53141.1 MerR family transcriptional regulator [Arthrobacter sp. FW305-BF8]